MRAEVLLAASHLLAVLERNPSQLTGYLWILTAVVYKGLGRGLFSKCLSESITLEGSFPSDPGGRLAPVLCSENQARKKYQVLFSYNPF